MNPGIIESNVNSFVGDLRRETVQIQILLIGQVQEMPSYPTPQTTGM